MRDRAALAEAFLQGCGWGDAARTPLAGDASQRRYLRLTGSGGSAVLMDAPGMGEQTRAFARIARHLSQAGFSTPEVLAADYQNGFLLLEDFGDALFAHAIGSGSRSEMALYRAAVDVLIRLHDLPVPGEMARFTPKIMAEQAELVFEFYAPDTDKAQKSAFRDELETVLIRHMMGPPVLILRDYHAENLIWLPDRCGLRRVGLLDFQDAMAGPVGYDLVSLLQDARRDVPEAVAQAMRTHFTTGIGVDPPGFSACYAALGAQRNLRILSIFARLAKVHGKSGYLDLIPRVWTHLTNALRDPALARLAEITQSNLPAPTPDHLAQLRAP